MPHMPSPRPGDPPNPKVHVLPHKAPDILHHERHPDDIIVRFIDNGLWIDDRTAGNAVWLVLSPSRLKELHDVLTEQLGDIGASTLLDEWLPAPYAAYAAHAEQALNRYLESDLGESNDIASGALIRVISLSATALRWMDNRGPLPPTAPHTAARWHG